MKIPNFVLDVHVYVLMLFSIGENSIFYFVRFFVIVATGEEAAGMNLIIKKLSAPKNASKKTESEL